MLPSLGERSSHGSQSLETRGERTAASLPAQPLLPFQKRIPAGPFPSAGLSTAVSLSLCHSPSLSHVIPGPPEGGCQHLHMPYEGTFFAALYCYTFGPLPNCFFDKYYRAGFLRGALAEGEKMSPGQGHALPWGLGTPGLATTRSDVERG